MASFFEANQARLSLKMKLHYHSWYNSSALVLEKDGFAVSVNVSKINNYVRKLVPPVINNVSIRINVE